MYGECLCKVSAMLDKYVNVSEPMLGEIKSSPIKLVLKEYSTPVFCKARQVPFALTKSPSPEIVSCKKQGFLYLSNDMTGLDPL